jgi:hypothetical protein
MEEMGASRKILDAVRKFATKSATPDQIRNGLYKIFRTRNRILQAFASQTDVTFTITNLKAAQNGPTTFTPLTMMDTMDQGIAGHEQRQVVVFVFPGVFKLQAGFRTCLVKARVFCSDQM